MWVVWKEVQSVQSVHVSIQMKQHSMWMAGMVAVFLISIS